MNHPETCGRLSNWITYVQHQFDTCPKYSTFRATRQDIEKLKTVSVCDEKFAQLYFVKWVSHNQTSLFDPTFVYDEIDTKDPGKNITVPKHFDPSSQFCSEGLHVTSWDCALGYLLQEHLVDKASTFHLLVCKIPLGAQMVKHNSNLYAKLKVSQVERIEFLAFDEHFVPWPMLVVDEEKCLIQCDICWSGAPCQCCTDNNGINPNLLWEVVYWLCQKQDVLSIVKCKQKIEFLFQTQQKATAVEEVEGVGEVEEDKWDDNMNKDCYWTSKSIPGNYIFRDLESIQSMYLNRIQERRVNEWIYFQIKGTEIPPIMPQIILYGHIFQIGVGIKKENWKKLHKSLRKQFYVEEESE